LFRTCVSYLDASRSAIVILWKRATRFVVPEMARLEDIRTHSTCNIEYINSGRWRETFWSSTENHWKSDDDVEKTAADHWCSFPIWLTENIGGLRRTGYVVWRVVKSQLWLDITYLVSYDNKVATEYTKNWLQLNF